MIHSYSSNCSSGVNFKFSSYRAYLNKYIKSLNRKPNKKSKIGPQDHENNVTTVSMLMIESDHPKAMSKHFGDDFRLEKIEKFKNDNFKVVGRLAELAARKAELVDKTPFDDFENNLALQFNCNKNLKRKY